MAIWILNAAHGGSDTGFIATNGRKESDVVLEAVMEAKKHLERNGEKVILLRDDDINIELEDRINKINGIKADYLVSFHMNNSKDKSQKGVVVEYVTGDSEEVRLAGLIKSEIFSGMKTLDNGIEKHKNYIDKRINKNTVIVYGDYLSNDTIAKEFDGKLYGKLVAKSCLALRDKVLLTISKCEPKKLQKRAWRVCIGYHKEYTDAMDYVLELNKIGIKDAYVVPYDG